jgi:hypothetical protein
MIKLFSSGQQQSRKPAQNPYHKSAAQVRRFFMLVWASQSDVVGNFPQGHNNMLNQFIQRISMPRTQFDDLPLDGGAKLACLNFVFTDFTSRSITLLEGASARRRLQNPSAHRCVQSLSIG